MAQSVRKARAESSGSFGEVLHCGAIAFLIEWQRTLVILALSFAPIGLAAARDTPTHPTGPAIEVALGLANEATYRDFRFDESLAPWARASVSYMGFSASGWMTHAEHRSIGELFLAYSHKLPLFDVHFGYARTIVDPMHPASFGSGRLVLSSNVSATTQVDFTLDRWTGSGAGRLDGLSVTRRVAETEAWTIDARASGSWWGRRTGDARAWSLRALGGRTLDAHWHLLGYAGYADGRTERPGEVVEDGFIAGLSIAWRP